MSHEFWVHLIVAAVGIALAFLAAWVVDRSLARRHLDAGTITRYRILRQSILGAIVFIGVLSALLVFPQVRAFAAAILASSAVIGLVLGFAAQRTIGNFIAGLLIAFTQPIRLGDEIEADGGRGIVEEIGLVYTWLRLPSNDRFAVPNERLVSEPILNATIRDSERIAAVSLHLPLNADLRAAVALLSAGGAEASVTDLASDATLTVRRPVTGGETVAHVEGELRVEAVERLRDAGIAAYGE
jgi:small-conductance mechanosensitive channel